MNFICKRNALDENENCTARGGCKCLVVVGGDCSEREDQKPLTCDGCRLDSARKMMPLAVNDTCQRCTRLPQRSDRYQTKVDIE